MTKLVLIGVGLLVAAVAVAALPLRGGSASAATRNVSVTDFAFTDALSATNVTTITAGDTIHWTWGGAASHTVTSDDGTSFDEPASPGFKMTGTFDKTFNTPGTYGYHCRIHGAPGQAMFGTIVVQAAANTDTPTATNTPAAAATDTPTPAVSATSTQTATVTPTSATTPAPNPAVAGATRAAAPTAAGGGAAGAGSLPRTGNGSGSGVERFPWLSIALAALGIAALCAAVVAPRRTHRR